VFEAATNPENKKLENRRENMEIKETFT